MEYTIEYWLDYYNFTGDEILKNSGDEILTAREWADIHVDCGLGHDEWDFEDVTEKLKYGELIIRKESVTYGSQTFIFDAAKPPTPKPPTPMQRLQMLYDLGQKHA